MPKRTKKDKRPVAKIDFKPYGAAIKAGRTKQKESRNKAADALFISKRTVDKHRSNILAKTGCRNTANLVVYAIKHNLVEI